MRNKVQSSSATHVQSIDVAMVLQQSSVTLAESV